MLNHSSATLYKGAFSLAMANSGMNPLIYAWKNRNFRKAFSNLLRCKNPDSFTPIDNNNTAVPNKSRKTSADGQETPPAAVTTPQVEDVPENEEDDPETHNKSTRGSYDAQSSDTSTTHLSKFSNSISASVS